LTSLQEERKGDVSKTKLAHLFPSIQDWKDSKWPILRGTILGFFLGILPGGGALISSFASYALEKKLSKHPEKFGTGVIEGVAGPESANNAATGGAFIPLFTLGIPANVVVALLMGTLMIQGIQPGPLLIQQYPEVFWGVIASMYTGNVILVILNLPLVGIWVKILKIPYFLLFPLIVLFCIIGVYSVNNNIMDIFVMILFGVIGYFMRKFGYEAIPMVLALVLGGLLELNFRQSLILSRGSLLFFLYRPISAFFMILAFLVILSAFLPSFKKILRYFSRKGHLAAL